MPLPLCGDSLVETSGYAFIASFATHFMASFVEPHFLLWFDRDKAANSIVIRPGVEWSFEPGVSGAVSRIFSRSELQLDSLAFLPKPDLLTEA